MKMHSIAGLCLACAACGPVRVDASSYDVGCTQDDDCALYPFDDVCAGCATVPIAAAERDRADAELASARLWCSLGVAECLQTLEPACDAQQCIARPLGSAQTEGLEP